VKFALSFAIKFNKKDVPLLGTPTIKTAFSVFFKWNLGKNKISKNKNKCVQPICSNSNGKTTIITATRLKVGRRKLFFCNEKVLKISFNIFYILFVILSS
jgi:hypothetical protein